MVLAMLKNHMDMTKSKTDSLSFSISGGMKYNDY